MTLHLALFFLPCRQAHGSLSWPVWTRGTVCRCSDGLLVNLHLALCFFLSSGPRSAASWPVWTRGTWTRSFTRPLCATTYAYGSDCIKLWSLRSCSPFLFVVIPVVAQMQILMVLHHRVFPAAVRLIRWSTFAVQVVACPLCATTDALVDDVAQFIDSLDVPVTMQRRELDGGFRALCSGTGPG